MKVVLLPDLDAWIVCVWYKLVLSQSGGLALALAGWQRWDMVYSVHGAVQTCALPICSMYGVHLHVESGSAMT